MQIECVDFVSVPTRDSARAVAWYRDVLGTRISGNLILHRRYARRG